MTDIAASAKRALITRRALVSSPLALGLALALPTASRAEGIPSHSSLPGSAAVRSKADACVRELLGRGRFMGAVLLARDGRVLLKRGYGMADLEQSVPCSTKTKFRLASLSKQFTAMGVLILQHQGRLSVDDPVSLHIPDCPAAWSGITIHHLLTHTSGIPNFTSFPDYLRRMPFPSSLLETIARFRDMPLDFPPGERYSYSNSGYAVLAYVIERVSGQAYGELLRNAIFEPLGMANTGCDSATPVIKARARGYATGPNGFVNAAYIDMSIHTGNGSLYSTLDDMLKWDQALYTEKLVPLRLLDLAFTPFKGNYGYGWLIDNRHGRLRISHTGGINGFSTHIARYPHDRACVILLSNVEGANVEAMADALAAIMFGRAAGGG